MTTALLKFVMSMASEICCSVSLLSAFDGAGPAVWAMIQNQKFINLGSRTKFLLFKNCNINVTLSSCLPLSVEYETGQPSFQKILYLLDMQLRTIIRVKLCCELHSFKNWLLIAGKSGKTLLRHYSDIQNLWWDINGNHFSVEVS